jgi:hypothetical protein
MQKLIFPKRILYDRVNRVQRTDLAVQLCPDQSFLYFNYGIGAKLHDETVVAFILV